MMFYDCRNLTSIDLGSFNTENVTDMSNMFASCSALKSLNLSHFKTQNVTDMRNMFLECKSLGTIDLSSFNTENVTDMGGMFNFCESLTSLDLSHFSTKKVTTMVSMFQGCKKLSSLTLSHFNTQKVKTTSHMFDDCRSLGSLDLSSFNTESVWDMSYMFSGCNALHTIYSSTNWTTENVSLSSSMFQGCSNLMGGQGTAFDSNYTDSKYAHIDGGTANPGYFTDINADQKPMIAVNTHEIDFGLVEYGTDKTERFTVTNTGTADVTIQVPQIREAGNAYFEISDVGKEFTLAPSKSKEYTVTCHGLKKGHWARVDFRVLSNADSGTETVKVKSVGWDNSPLLSETKLTMKAGDSKSIQLQGTYGCSYEISNNNPTVADVGKGGDTSQQGTIGFDGYYGSASSCLNIQALAPGVATVKVVDSITKEEATLSITVVSETTPEGSDNQIVMERDYFVNKANKYCCQESCFRMDNGLQLEIRYFNTDYYQGSYSNTRHGIYIAVGHCDDVNYDWNVSDCDYFDAWYIGPVVTDEWVKEKIVFDASGNVHYFMNGEDMGTHHFDMLTQLAYSKTVTFDINPYGWWTGHQHYMDNLKLTLPSQTISDDFNDGVLDQSIWQEPTNPAGVREEDGILKTEQVRTDWPYHLRTHALPLSGDLVGGGGDATTGGEQQDGPDDPDTAGDGDTTVSGGEEV